MTARIDMAGRRSLVVVTALLVVLAGCSGLGPGATDPGSAETTTDTGLDPDAEPVYDTPLNTTEVAVDHVVELRRAGSFAYESTITIVDTNQSATVEMGREARVDMESGAMLVTRNDSGMSSRDTYITGDGTTYRRTVMDSSSISFNVSDSEIDTSRYAINGVPRFLDMFELTYDGLTTLDGQEVYRYSATSPEQVSSLRGFGPGTSNDSVESIEAHLYVTKTGLITQLGYSVAFDTGDGMHNIKAVTKFEDVGEVSVSQPDWVEDAKAADRGELNVTRTLTNETADAELTLTANRALFDSIQLLAGPGPLYNGNNTYEEAAASSAVTAVIPPTATNASVTIAYDESAVPDGGESELAVYRYVIEEGTWAVVEASQDTAADEFTVDLSKSETLVVMHEPTWNELDPGHT